VSHLRPCARSSACHTFSMASRTPTARGHSFGLLTAFLSLLRQPSDAVRGEFVAKFTTWTRSDSTSLFVLVLSATQKRRPPKTSTAIDDRAIDGLSYILRQFLDHFYTDPFASACFTSLDTIREWAVDCQLLGCNVTCLIHFHHSELRHAHF
jgi:hypothetical protein